MIKEAKRTRGDTGQIIHIIQDNTKLQNRKKEVTSSLSKVLGLNVYHLSILQLHKVQIN